MEVKTKDLGEKSNTRSSACFTEDMDECAICRDTYKEPRLLHCMHTFCDGCVNELLKRSNGAVGQRKVVCPKCRFETKETGVGLRLLRNHIVQQNVRWMEVSQMRENNALQCSDCESEVATQLCSNCQWKLCDDCTAHHKKRAKSKDHVMTSLEAVSAEELFEKELPHCSKHQKELEVYCKTCDSAICNECVLEKQHEGHVFQSLDVVVDERSKELNTMFLDCESVYKGYGETLSEMDEFHQKSLKGRDECVARIETYFGELEKILLEEKQRLIDWLNEKCLESGKALSSARTRAKHVKGMSDYLLAVSRYPKDEVGDILIEGLPKWEANLQSIKTVIEERKKDTEEKKAEFAGNCSGFTPPAQALPVPSQRQRRKKQLPKNNNNNALAKLFSDFKVTPKNEFKVEVSARRIGLNTDVLDRIKSEMRKIGSLNSEQPNPGYQGNDQGLIMFSPGYNDQHHGFSGGFSFSETKFPDQDRAEDLVEPMQSVAFRPMNIRTIRW